MAGAPPADGMVPVKLALVTDAWFPQINGVVRTLSTTADELARLGHSVETISPDLFRWTIPCPTYSEIRLAMGRVRPRVREMIEAFGPDAIHIATEGPLGMAARAHCQKRGLPFTTSFHTFFPDYLYLRFRVPRGLSFGYLRWFHRPSEAVMISTPTMHRVLTERGFDRLAQWARAVDTDLFRPRDKSFLDLPRPIYMFVGRVAVEKNLDAFLSLDLDGTKVVVGDGPQLPAFRDRYPDARFVGAKIGEDLARHYAAADVFVFPSRTETFGLVMLEALASGVPVAAYPVQGPLDIVTNPEVGVLDEDLAVAARRALGLSAERCREHALGYSWSESARQFLGNLRQLK